MATAAREGTRLSDGDGTFVPSRSTLEREAFQGFPYGLLVLDGAGRVVCVNDQAARLIEQVGLSQQGLTCCSLLGCGRESTPLAGRCVTELAIGGGAPRAEVRLEIGGRRGQLAVWVAAGTVGGEDERVILQLRPGIAGDRRRHSGLYWTASGPKLRIRCLGRTVVETAEGQLGGAWLDQRTGQLLKFLVAERRRAVAVDEIGESIWPGADYAVGTNVRYHIHALRRKLEPQRGTREPSTLILARSGTYRLSLDELEVDADLFEAHLNGGLGAAKADQRRAAEELERGLALYHGDFMADLPYAEWAISERHRLHDLACLGLRALADIRMEQRVIDGAARCLERLAILQPYDEDVHRRLMELDLMRGRRSDVVRRYETLRTRMRNTFGHDPNFTPADLARARL
jgi:DNA-binding SARP family transcriptional activator